MIPEIDPEKEYIFKTKADMMSPAREYRKKGKYLTMAEKHLVETWLRKTNL